MWWGLKYAGVAARRKAGDVCMCADWQRLVMGLPMLMVLMSRTANVYDFAAVGSKIAACCMLWCSTVHVCVTLVH
jgi:hypothetical protein